MKIVDAYELYLQYVIVERGLSAQTVECYKDDLNMFYSFINKTQIEELDYRNIDDFIVYLSNQGKSNKTIIRRASTVRSFFNFLQQENLIKKESIVIDMPN